MQHAFLDAPPAPVRSVSQSFWLESLFPGQADTLVAYVAPDAEAGQAHDMLRFVVEMKLPSDASMVYVQRLLAVLACELLGPGFARQGAHIAFAGERISYAARRRLGETSLAQLALYLPAGGAPGDLPALTALRLPGSAQAFAEALMQRFVDEMQEAEESMWAGRATTGWVRD